MFELSDGTPVQVVDRPIDVLPVRRDEWEEDLPTGAVFDAAPGEFEHDLPISMGSRPEDWDDPHPDLWVLSGVPGEAAMTSAQALPEGVDPRYFAQCGDTVVGLTTGLDADGAPTGEQALYAVYPEPSADPLVVNRSATPYRLLDDWAAQQTWWPPCVDGTVYTVDGDVAEPSTLVIGVWDTTKGDFRQVPLTDPDKVIRDEYYCASYDSWTACQGPFTLGVVGYEDMWWDGESLYASKLATGVSRRVFDTNVGRDIMALELTDAALFVVFGGYQANGQVWRYDLESGRGFMVVEFSDSFGAAHPEYFAAAANAYVFNPAFLAESR
jgi:hypothetical protein